MALQHRLRAGIGFLQVDAPVFQLLERDRDAGDGAAHERPRPDHAEVAVEELDVRLARHGRWAIVAVEHRIASVDVAGGLPDPNAPTHPNIMVRARPANPPVRDRLDRPPGTAAWYIARASWNTLHALPGRPDRCRRHGRAGECRRRRGGGYPARRRRAQGGINQAQG